MVNQAEVSFAFTTTTSTSTLEIGEQIELACSTNGEVFPRPQLSLFQIWEEVEPSLLATTSNAEVSWSKDAQESDHGSSFYCQSVQTVPHDDDIGQYRKKRQADDDDYFVDDVELEATEAALSYEAVKVTEAQLDYEEDSEPVEQLEDRQETTTKKATINTELRTTTSTTTNATTVLQDYVTESIESEAGNARMVTAESNLETTNSPIVSEGSAEAAAEEAATTLPPTLAPTIAPRMAVDPRFRAGNQLFVVTSDPSKPLTVNFGPTPVIDQDFFEETNLLVFMPNETLEISLQFRSRPRIQDQQIIWTISSADEVCQCFQYTNTEPSVSIRNNIS